MREIFENEKVVAFYKEKGEHTLSSSDYTKDDSLFLYRLDLVTSGILIKAKTKEFFEELKNLQKENRIVKTYIAFSSFTEDTVFFDKEESQSAKKEIDKNSQFSLSTYFRPFLKGRKTVKAVKIGTVNRYKNKDVTEKLYTTNIVECIHDSEMYKFKVNITNGFRHQIRSHLSFIGFPILGDTLYGGAIGHYEELYKNGIALECVSVDIDGLKIKIS